MSRPPSVIGRILAFSAYSIALLGAVYWTCFLLTDVLTPPKTERDTHPGKAVFNIATLPVYIAAGQNNDNYQNVDINVDGQIMSLFLDTTVADMLVASSECEAVGPTSPCYNIDNAFHVSSINSDTGIVDETFRTSLYTGIIHGNVSYLDITFGDLIAKDVPTGLIYSAPPNYFRNGSYTGVLGLGLRQASFQWRQRSRLPVIDTAITQGVFEDPMFSLSSPRYGDPEQSTGGLTVGDIEGKYGGVNLTFADVVPFSRTPDIDLADGVDRLLSYGWTFELEGFRMNGVEVEVTPGRVRPDKKHVSVLDTGASGIFVRTSDFNRLMPLFDGLTKVEEQRNMEALLWFECDKPQLLEVKTRGEWFLVDPLDLMEANADKEMDGVRMCLSTLRPYDSTDFGDSLMGLPFLRSVIAVFDYVSENMYSQPPGLGVGSTVDKGRVVARYGEIVKNRML